MKEQNMNDLINQAKASTNKKTIQKVVPVNQKELEILFLHTGK